jgi:hypothetical protein
VAQKASANGKSELQPNRVYSCTIEKTYKGNDGFQEVPTTQSIRHINITTGEKTGDGIEVALVALRPRPGNAGANADAAIDWKGSFTLSVSGAITNIKQNDGEGGMNAVSMEGFIARQLASVLFNPVYDFRMKPALRIEFATPKKGRGATAMQDMEYTLNGDPNAPIPEEQGMLVTRSGKASFDAAEKIYTRNEFHENSRIAVAPTAVEDGKEVIVATTVVTTITVKPK